MLQNDGPSQIESSKVETTVYFYLNLIHTNTLTIVARIVKFNDFTTLITKHTARKKINTERHTKLN